MITRVIILRYIDPLLGIMKNPRFYNWMITIFKDEESKLFEWKFPDNKLKFMVYQYEICPSTEKEHIQGYMEFTEKVSMKWIKENIENNCVHLEPRKGTQKQAIDYCTKEETRKEGTKPFFYGSQKSQGNRSDLDSIVDAIEEGMTSKEILLLFRGNALRHFNMITNGLKAFHSMCKVDEEIMFNRYANEMCLEVEGNTKGPSTSK